MLHKHNIFNGVWAIEPGFSDNHLPRIISYLKGENGISSQEKINPLSIQPQPSSLHAGTQDNSQDSSFLAVVSISGAITKHSQFCGPVGMVDIASILEECYANEDITGIVLHIESGGGEFMAMRLLNEAIGNRNKPMVAFIDDFCCSAAYGIASACDVVVANSTMARIGSIGTYMSIADYSKKLEKEGIDIKEIYATDSKHKNGEVREALKGNLKPLQELTDTYNNHFLEMIETNRAEHLKFGREIWGTGRVYFAEDALKAGLIDEINTFTNTLKIFTWKS